MEAGEVKCPSCKTNMPELEIKTTVGKEIFEKMQQKIFAKFVEQSGLVRCTCGNMLELVQGTINLNQKDDKGKALTQYWKE